MELKKEKYTFDDFVKIVAELRGENGCPWDREQTHKSLKKCLIEEAYELCEAIDKDIPEKIADESGDVLLQVVLNAQIGKDDGEYDINDVTDFISRKMIHRHPHVFGDVKAETAEDVITNWDAIKREDRNQTSIADELRGVSAYIPTLMRAQKIGKKAKKAGYNLEYCELSNCTEEDIGKLLFQICSTASNMGIDADVALSGYINKFIGDFEKYEKENK